MQPALENVFVCALAKTVTCQAPVHNDDENTDLFHSVLQTHMLSFSVGSCSERIRTASCRSVPAADSSLEQLGFKFRTDSYCLACNCVCVFPQAGMRLLFGTSLSTWFVYSNTASHAKCFSDLLLLLN